MIAETMKRRQWLARLGERWLIPHSSVPRISRYKSPDKTRLPMTAAGHVALEEELRHRTGRIARPRLVQQIQQAYSDDANLIENSNTRLR